MDELQKEIELSIAKTPKRKLNELCIFKEPHEKVSVPEKTQK